MFKYAIPGSVKTAEPNWAGVPLAYVNKVSAVCRTMAECNDLVGWFDGKPDFCPDMPVLLLIPNVDKPIAVCGMGFATAAELRDTCIEVWGSKNLKQQQKGSQFDFDDLRERAGELPREKVAEMTAYAYWDRLQRHKASPVTDPWKRMRYPNPKGRTKFVQVENKGWK